MRAPHRDRTRPVVLLLGISVLAALLAGCGSDDDDTEGAVTDAAAAGPDADETTDEATDEATDATDVPSQYPVTIEHKFGETVIPATPQRVVSLGYTEQDSIVLVGVEPIAVRYAFGPEDDVFFPWADAAAGDADPEILPRAEINFEQIAALDPDLIMGVTAGLDETQYETLSAIAPTVVQPAEYVDFGTPWQVQTRIAGHVFGQADRAEEIIAEVEARFAAARDAHPELAGLSVALSGPSYEGEYPIHASSDTRTRWFTDLGLAVPAELDAIAGDQFYGTLSREQAALLDTDILVWQAGSAEERTTIESDPVLAALAVVREGRAVFIEGSDYDALQFSSALSLPYLLDGFLPELAAAVG
jgi:iron complex transport system substrate-binding protein